MIHINSYKLTPAITATWGDITGNVSNQEDLVEYISEHGTAAWGSISGNISDQVDLMSTLGSYATESWVSSKQFATESWVSGQGYLTSVPSEYATQSWVSEQGYLTEHQSLEGYATESWVSEQGYLTSSALTGYATESWVSEQGYLTSVPSEYATQSWVSEQGYLTSTSLKTVNNQSLVGEGNIEIGSLTPQQEEALQPLVNRNNGILTTDITTKPQSVGFAEAPSSDQYGQIWVYNINNDVYMINWMNLEDDGIYPYIYKWNSTTWKFEVLTYHDEVEGDIPVVISGISSPVVSAVTDPHVIWSDTQGRYYFNNTHTITFTEAEWIFTEHQMGGNLQTYNGLKSNIVKLSNGIYMLYGPSTASQARAWKFNEETQVFDAYGSGASFAGYQSTNWYRYVFYYDGKPYFTKSSGTILFEFKIMATKIMGAAVAAPFPMTFTYDDRSFTITGDRIRKVTVNNEDIYIYYYGQSAFKLNTNSNPKTWDYLDLTRLDTFSYNANGVEAGDLMFGFGYNEEVSGQIPVWNFGDVTIENYGWDKSLEERVSTLEQNYAGSVEMTNNILGV